jgi:hypothetical protein
MLRLKRVVFLLVLLGVVVLNIDFSISDAQTKRGTQSGPAVANQKGPKLNPLPVREGVDYSKFDHASHSPDCLSCHIPNRTPKTGLGKEFSGKVKQPESAKTPFTYDDRVTQFPPHAACEECHLIFQFTLAAKVGAKPTIGAKYFCQICHEADSQTVLAQFPKQREDQFGMKFPHDIHQGIKSKSYNVGPKIAELTDEEKKLQAVAISSGCNECHVKDGKDKNEENFSIPYHPECARCHSETPTDPAAKDDPNFKIKNEKPYMSDCLGCHKPFMSPRPVVSDIVVQTGVVKPFNVDRINPDKPYKPDSIPFTHSYSSHEQDQLKKKDVKVVVDGKEKLVYPNLDCRFCHKEAAKSKRMQDVVASSIKDACLPCHNDGKNGSKQIGHELTLGEKINLRP